ncbi:PilZ domain-containing protein [Neobacillus sp. 114]|uniref:PilZ domain-containing protein n=1 Tax=Neobacillus sp. 114 TaxID=3048535 RepID=UPI0024C2EAD1|nr:PilZ domain-containing protein [Neobacillus sp. 114]
MALKLYEHADSLRVKIQYPVESELTLVKVGEDLENIEIIIENVGPGGLRFVSNLQLELDQEIIYSIESEFLEDKISIPGVVIWKEEISKDLFQYGVHFETPEQTRAFLNQLLG